MLSREREKERMRLRSMNVYTTHYKAHDFSAYLFDQGRHAKCCFMSFLGKIDC